MKYMLASSHAFFSYGSKLLSTIRCHTVPKIIGERLNRSVQSMSTHTMCTRNSITRGKGMESPHFLLRLKSTRPFRGRLAVMRVTSLPR